METLNIILDILLSSTNGENSLNNTWVLYDGYWNDEGVWDDDEFWND